MEFKGTKGKWEVGGDTVDGILISSNHPQNRDIATIWRYDNDFLENQEMRANALLISKALEFLEETQDTIVDLKILKCNIADAAKTNYRLEGMPEVIQNWIDRKEQLIKEATTLGV